MTRERQWDKWAGSQAGNGETIRKGMESSQRVACLRWKFLRWYNYCK